MPKIYNPQGPTRKPAYLKLTENDGSVSILIVDEDGDPLAYVLSIEGSGDLRLPAGIREDIAVRAGIVVDTRGRIKVLGL